MLFGFLREIKSPEQDIVWLFGVFWVCFLVDCINIVNHSTSIGGGNAPNRRLPTVKRFKEEEEVSGPKPLVSLVNDRRCRTAGCSLGCFVSCMI